jgi:hypothetical protein
VIAHGAVVLGLAGALACSRVPTPPHLAGLHRTAVVTGARAERLATWMHPATVAPLSTTIADYGRRGELRLYLSTFPNQESAFRAFDAMIQGIRAGDTAFRVLREDPALPGRWVTYGPGGHHMIWVSRRQLFWLQGDPETVERAAAELPAPLIGSWT